MSLEAEELYDYVTQEMTGTPVHEVPDGVSREWATQSPLSSWDDDWRDEWDDDDWDDDGWDDEDDDDDDWDDDDDDWDDDGWDDDDEDWDDEDDEWGTPEFFDTRSEHGF
jgi:hypothetical protein